MAESPTPTTSPVQAAPPCRYCNGLLQEGLVDDAKIPCSGGHDMHLACVLKRIRAGEPTDCPCGAGRPAFSVIEGANPPVPHCSMLSEDVVKEALAAVVTFTRSMRLHGQGPSNAEEERQCALVQQQLIAAMSTAQTVTLWTTEQPFNNLYAASLSALNVVVYNALGLSVYAKIASASRVDVAHLVPGKMTLFDLAPAVAAAAEASAQVIVSNDPDTLVRAALRRVNGGEPVCVLAVRSFTERI